MKRCIALLLVLAASLVVPRQAFAELEYGFDDGTFQGWELLNVFGEPLSESTLVSWVPSADAIDIGSGFTLLPATSGDYRVVPDPFGDRDCIGLECDTTILRSPAFQITEAGDLTIDMIGGGAHGDQPFDETLVLPLGPDTLPEKKTSDKQSGALQGFALLDVAAGDYVAYGFSSYENDGKARDTDPPTRCCWETVAISSDDLAPLLNNGKEYQIDIFDSYSGGWGWIGFDTVRIPTTGPGATCDLNGDGAVDAADAGIMFSAWGAASAGEPADKNADGFVDAADAGVMFAQWTGDPGPVGAGEVAAEYNPATGELKLSSNGVINVFVQSASGAITPLDPAPTAPVGLLTNNANRVGITNLGPINTENFNFGSIGAGLAMSDLSLIYTVGFGQSPQTIPATAGGAFNYIPEPASIGMIVLGLGGLLAVRRRV